MSTLPERFRVLRGSSERSTDFMEQYQIAWIRAVAAASGTSASGFTLDDGVDVALRHSHRDHQDDKVARIDVQLKATTTKPFGGFARVRMSRRRFDEFASLPPTFPKIVVIMIMPKDPVHWLWASHRSLNLFGNNYWVNLAGETSSAVEEVTVKAPTRNVLDDVALAKIMERVGKGGHP